MEYSITFEDIKNNIDLQTYKFESAYALQRKLLKPGTIIDEDQTVRWNKEQVETRNETIRKQIEEIRNNNNKQHDIFKAHLFEAANKHYRLNDNQCDMIYNKLMSESDFNYVCTDFVDEFEDFCDFVYQCWNA